jgi:hypothetical protein
VTVRVVGAGLGRTGTLSLKLALERILGGPCYHMIEVFGRPDHIAAWHAAVRGDLPEWRSLFRDFAAVLDWPAVAFWREISAAYPDAIILLSVRDAESWWRSCDATIFEVFKRSGEGLRSGAGAWFEMVRDVFRERFTPDFLDRDAAIAAYERHNDEVRRTADPRRLVEWRPGDGWEPICSALGLSVPDEPFPHTNTTEEFRSRAGWDA